MAATMTDSGDLLYTSFPIDKMETNDDGDLIVYGKASDGGVDADQQIVDPAWMAKAVQEWMSSGPNIRVQHSAQRDPAGVGLEASTDANGATWVKGLVCEPVAKKLVSKGALRAYSVGIARPTVERDMVAKGGRITSGTLVEVSLVDRPANARCGFQLVKSAEDGTAEFTGKVFGDEDVIAKFVGADLMAKSAALLENPVQEDMTLTFTPNDLAKLLKSKIIDQHYDELAAKAANDTTEKGESVADAPTIDTSDATAAKEAEPVITKDPEGEKASKPKKKGKKLPPWMQDDPKGDNDDSSCKTDHAHTEKCSPSGTPQSASGAKDAAPMQEIPSTSPAPESPMPAGRKTPDTKGMGMSPETAALLRFKSIGMDSDLGRLHDMTCPAYDPNDVLKYHPFTDFSTLLDEDLWMRKAVDAATGPMDQAMAMTEVWRAVNTLKNADMADLNEYRAEMHKAFRDANPGPTTYPSPGAMSPQKFKRPVITDGHAADSPGHDGPNTSPSVATGPPNAHSFNRPPLGSGHQSPSPSFMKGSGQYPGEQGIPTQLVYTHIEKDKARRALSMLHDHLSHQFPLGCPMVEQDAYRVDAPAQTLNPVVGASKAQVTTANEPEVAKTEDKVMDLPFVSKTGIEEMDALLSSIEKGMKKKLGKKVLSGSMTVDEARAKIGRRMARKQQECLADAVEKGEMTIAEARGKMSMTPQEPVAKSAEPEVIKSEIVTLTASPVLPAFDPEIIKTAIADAIAPLVAKVDAQQKVISEQEARWETAANLPDPKTTAWAGLALNKNVRPAGVATIAENAERTQINKMRQMHEVWRTSNDPFEREAARAELDKFGFTE